MTKQSFQIVEKWANWDAEKRRVVVPNLISKEAAILEATARYKAQGQIPFVAYVVEAVNSGSES